MIDQHNDGKLIQQMINKTILKGHKYVGTYSAEILTKRKTKQDWVALMSQP